MRVTTGYEECPKGLLTRCNRLAVEATSGEDMDALGLLARLLTGGEPVGAVVRRLVAADADRTRTARVIAEAEAVAGRHEPQPEEPAGPEVP